MHSLSLIRFCVDYLHVLHAPLPIYPFCHLALLWSGVCCLPLPCRCCPPPFCHCCLCVFASGALWDLRFLAFSGSAGSPPFSVLCALLVSGAVSVFPCCLLSLVVFPVSVLLASPAPRIVSCVLWPSLHSCVLVPPSEYLVAAVTAPLPCFHAGCMVLLCFPSVIRFMATKAFCPVWGFLPSTPCYW